MKTFNPAISLILAFIFSLLVSFSTFDVIYLLPIFTLFYYVKKHLRAIFKKLLFLNLFIFVLFLVLLIESSLEEALNVYIRTNVIILFNLCVFYSSKGYDIVRGLCLLKFPDKFTSSTFFTLKMIESLTSDFKNIKTTLKARGFKANSSMFTYYTFGNVLGMLFVKSIRKSNSLKDSFIARGFDGKIYLNDEFKISKVDYSLIFAVALTVLLKVVL